MIVLVAVLAFYVAWNLGANDVANSMGTSVGSKAVTLRQALVIAGVLEFTGAVLFGHEVSETLATEIVNPALFADAPQVLLVGRDERHYLDASSAILRVNYCLFDSSDRSGVYSYRQPDSTASLYL